MATAHSAPGSPREPRRRLPTTKPAVLLRVALALGGALGGVGVGLAFVWPVAPHNELPAWYVHDTAGCSLGFAPNARVPGDARTALETDGDGFRVWPDHLAPREVPARCRVLALGDSFTEALAVEPAAAWPARLEVGLRERGLRVSLLNAGVRGHTITDERTAALVRFADVDVGLVLLQTTANDLIDLDVKATSGCVTDTPPAGRFEGAATPDDPAARESARSSHVLRHRVSRARTTLFPSDVLVAACDHVKDDYFRALDALAAGLAARERKLVVAVWETPVCRARENETAWVRRATANVSARGGRLVDLRPTLLSPEAHASATHSHPSALGHELMARALADDLVASHLLDACVAR